jgi:hypothetical protein
MVSGDVGLELHAARADMATSAIRHVKVRRTVNLLKFIEEK